MSRGPWLGGSENDRVAMPQISSDRFLSNPSWCIENREQGHACPFAAIAPERALVLHKSTTSTHHLARALSFLYSLPALEVRFLPTEDCALYWISLLLLLDLWFAYHVISARRCSRSVDLADLCLMMSLPADLCWMRYLYWANLIGFDNYSSFDDLSRSFSINFLFLSWYKWLPVLGVLSLSFCEHDLNY